MYMKRTLLFFCTFIFFILAYTGRYHPVSLDLVSPSTKQVEVKGEVNKPGVYTIKWEGDMQDAIEAAGGFSEQADTRSLSLTSDVQDKDVIVVAKLDQQKEKISINSATQEQLMELAGIGPSIANRIIEYRQETSFSTLDQLMEVKGIGPKMYQRIKDDIIL